MSIPTLLMDWCTCGRPGRPILTIPMNMEETTMDSRICGHPGLPCQYVKLESLGSPMTNAHVGVLDAHVWNRHWFRNIPTLPMNAEEAIMLQIQCLEP
jgi:hypothetical protein